MPANPPSDNPNREAVSVIYLVGKAHATDYRNGSLSLPPSGGEKARMGVALWVWAKSNLCSPKSHPLPSPLPPDG